MDKKYLIKGILELGEELDKDNTGLGELMIINDMELLVDKYTNMLLIKNKDKRCKPMTKAQMYLMDEAGLLAFTPEQFDAEWKKRGYLF